MPMVLAQLPFPDFVHRVTNLEDCWILPRSKKTLKSEPELAATGDRKQSLGALETEIQKNTIIGNLLDSDFIYTSLSAQNQGPFAQSEHTLATDATSFTSPQEA